MPQFVRPGFVGKIAGTVANVASAAAAGVTYLLRATFSGADTGAMANGADVETQSSGSVEDGALTVRDNDANMSVAVTSNKLSCTKTSGGTAAPDIGVYGGAYTRAAGRCIGATYNCSADGVGRNVQIYDSNAGGIPAFADRLYMARAGYTTNGIDFYTFNPAGTVADGFVTSVPVAAGNDLKVRLVQGGFDSAGAPDATGDYGAMMFVHNLTDWELVAASSRGLNTATFYPDFLISESVGGNTTQTLDDIFISETTVESVFTPAGGYALDTFTDTNGTLLTAHTGETSLVWTTLVGGGSSYNSSGYDIQANEANALAGVVGAVADTGLSDCWVHAHLTDHSTTFWHHVIFRCTDESNLWLAQHDGGSFKLYEQVSGSFTQRASSSVTGTAPATISVRLSGTSLEAWYNGGAKVSYTSSLYQTNTKHGFGGFTSGHDVDNFYVLPLISATYADLDF